MNNPRFPALRESRYLIVICSPRATSSAYVNEEILEFKRLGRGDRLLAIIVAGEPGASRLDRGLDPALEAFPEALRHPLGAGGNLDRTRAAEPIAADVRDSDGREITLRDSAHSSFQTYPNSPFFPALRSPPPVQDFN